MISQPNILWITVDTLRYDHTSLAGYHRDTTPNLQRIANEYDGQTFRHCISHAQWTQSSVASMLTGTYPNQHEVGYSGNDRPVPDAITSIASRFSNAGYRTACISENWIVGPELGLTRGFERYMRVSKDIKETLRKAQKYPKAVGKYLAQLNRHSGGFTTDGNKHSVSYLSTEITKRWLGELEKDRSPYFFYLHLNGPHGPYYPPNSHFDRFIEDVELSNKEAGRLSIETYNNLHRFIAEGCKLDAHQWEAIEALYDAEIAYTDYCIGRIYEFLKKQEGQTILVITSDHGELLGEYGLFGHRIVLDDAVVQVPLVTSGFDAIHHQADNLVQHTDLVRTLLELAGAPTSEIAGVDLRKVIRDYAVSFRGADRYRRNIREFERFDDTFDSSQFHDGDLAALRTKEEKLLRSDSRTDIVSLADETRDLSDQNPERVEQLEEELSKWLDGLETYVQQDSITDDEELKEQLADLGYLNS